MGLLKKLKNRFLPNRYSVKVERFDLSDTSTHPTGLLQIMNLLNYTKTSGVSYSAGAFNAGYHSFDIDGHHLVGQRNPAMRLSGLPFDFTGKRVLDLGCNQGGMLHAIADRIAHGTGVDYDARMINTANKIKAHTGRHHLDFFVLNLETEPLGYLNDLAPKEGVDIVFMLSIAMWIKTWREVIDFSAKLAPQMLFESNGTPEQQTEQVDYLKKVYRTVERVREQSDDDPSQKNRQLFLCSR